jgi:hypothetical protein
MADAKHVGGCLCGAVRYEATGPLRGFVACHCRHCRKQSGHYPAFTNVPLDRFALTRQDALRWYSASDQAQRGFCADCGSFLFWWPQTRTHISISGGSFDGPTGGRIEKHIFCADKGDYYEIADPVPHLSRW